MRDDDDAKNLLSPLDNEIPDSTVDVSHLVRRGRRKVNIRRTMVGMAATAVVAAGIPLALLMIRSPQAAVTNPAAITCQMQRLPLPPGTTNGAVFDGEPSGRYLVGVVGGVEGIRNVLWDRGELTLLNPPVADPHNIVVNSTGMVAGSGENASGQGVAWVYRDGKYQVLPRPGNSGVLSVVDISEHGDVLGNIDLPNKGKVPLAWATDPVRVVRQMNLPAGMTDAEAIAFHDSGSSLVRAKGPDGESRSLMWTPNDEVEELASPFSAARAVAWTWHGDWAVGWYTPPGGKATAVRWNMKSAIADALPSGMLPNVVNRQGWAAGSASAADGTEYPVIALDGGKLVNLPIPPESVEALKDPGNGSPTVRSVSDDGTTAAGTVSTGERKNLPLRWTCG